MGVDYGGRRGVFHLTWYTHGYAARLLDLLGVDLGEWSSANDGVYVRAATCRDWGRRIRGALDAGAVLDQEAAVAGRTGDACHRPAVAGAPDPSPGSVAWALDLVDAARGATDWGDAAELPPVLAGELRGFAGFLEGCGGCWQY